MGEDKCWAGCGSEGNHPELGPHYWPCGTMKSATIRGEACYALELEAQAQELEAAKARIAELEAKLQALMVEREAGKELAKEVISARNAVSLLGVRALIPAYPKAQALLTPSAPSEWVAVRRDVINECLSYLPADLQDYLKAAMGEKP